MPKLLRKADPSVKPKKIELHPKVIKGSKVTRNENGEVQVSTTMPDGHVIGWAGCGVCRTHITNCRCKNGPMHPSSVEWIYIRNKMVDAGSSYAKTDRIERSHPEVQKFAVYWYAGKQTQTLSDPLPSHTPRSTTLLPKSKKTPKIVKRVQQEQTRLGKIAKQREIEKAKILPGAQGRPLTKKKPLPKPIDLAKIDRDAKVASEKRVGDLMKRLEEDASPKPLKKKGKKKK